MSLADHASTNLLVWRLSRSQLEQLVIDAADHGTEISKQSILDLLPSNMHNQAVSISLAGTFERTRTSCFDWLDVDLLVLILSQTPLESKLNCAVAVCKPWRALKGAASLWQTLELGASWTDGYEKFCTHPEAPMRISSSGIKRLVEWLGPASLMQTVQTLH